MIDFQAKLIHDLVAEKWDVGQLRAIVAAMSPGQQDEFWNVILTMPIRGLSTISAVIYAAPVTFAVASQGTTQLGEGGN